MLPHQLLKIKLEEAKKTLPKAQLKWKRLPGLDNDSENESELESDLESDSDSSIDDKSSSEPDIEPEKYDWNFYWNLYKESDDSDSENSVNDKADTEAKIDHCNSTKEEMFYDNFIQTSDDPWEALKEEEAAIEKFLSNQ